MSADLEFVSFQISNSIMFKWLIIVDSTPNFNSNYNRIV